MILSLLLLFTFPTFKSLFVRVVCCLLSYVGLCVYLSSVSVLFPQVKQAAKVAAITEALGGRFVTAPGTVAAKTSASAAAAADNDDNDNDNDHVTHFVTAYRDVWI